MRHSVSSQAYPFSSVVARDFNEPSPLARIFEVPSYRRRRCEHSANVSTRDACKPDDSIPRYEQAVSHRLQNSRSSERGQRLSNSSAPRLSTKRQVTLVRVISPSQESEPLLS